MSRYFIDLAYKGTNYCGWQVQPNGISVQEKVEQSLTTLLRSPVAITGAGRTDAGVHAKKMIAHFDFEGAFEPDFLTEKMNRLLPFDIAVHSIVNVSPEAHARFDALSRTYQYYLTDKKDPFHGDFVYKVSGSLNFDRMNQAAQILLEYTDFTSFSKLHTDVKTNNCSVKKAVWEQTNDGWVFTIEADRFLRNMVRAIVGTLLEVGRGKSSLDDFRRVIESKDRGKAGTSAPAHALFLVDITYPETILSYPLF
jgi:tRNA pseudouridine38-40 synthase